GRRRELPRVDEEPVERCGHSGCVLDLASLARLAVDTLAGPQVVRRAAEQRRQAGGSHIENLVPFDSFSWAEASARRELVREALDELRSDRVGIEEAPHRRPTV